MTIDVARNRTLYIYMIYTYSLRQLFFFFFFFLSPAHFGTYLHTAQQDREGKMVRFVYFLVTLLGIQLPVIDAHFTTTFEGVSPESPNITDFKCLPGGFNTTDFPTAAGMLSSYCRNYKIARRSPYAAVVGQTIAYVCSETGIAICSGTTMDFVDKYLTRFCGHGIVGYVHIGGENSTIYGRGIIGMPLCRKLGAGQMKNYKIRPIATFINGSLVGKW